MFHRKADIIGLFQHLGMLISVGLTVILAPAVARAADPTGDWKTEGGGASIRIAQCYGNMWGVVAWEKDGGSIDKNNPNESKKRRSTLGMPFLIDMKRNAAGDKWAGQLYDPGTGKMFDATIQLSSPDELEMQACLQIFCSGQTWTRVGPPIASSPANSLSRDARKRLALKTVPVPPKAAAVPSQTPPQTAGPNATTGTLVDAVGDICLIPDIANNAR